MVHLILVGVPHNLIIVRSYSLLWGREVAIQMSLPGDIPVLSAFSIRVVAMIKPSARNLRLIMPSHFRSVDPNRA